MLALNIADAHVAALEQICERIAPTAVLTAKTPLGRVVGPRLAYRMGVGVAQDCMDLTGEKTSSKITVKRPVYGGNAMAAFTFTNKDPQFIVLRIKAFEPLERDDARIGEIVELDLDINDDQVRVKLIETIKEESEGVKLEDASVIVSGGRGLGGPEPFSQLEELAKMFNGAVGASRAVCDAGWLDHSYQVGLTGKTVSPDLYITVGISGASQHMAGCSSSKSIVAINKLISNHTGVATLYVTGLDSGRNSLFLHDLPQAGTVSVDTISVDEFLIGEGWPAIDLVKVDVEGSEALVWEGMALLRGKAADLRLIMEFNPALLRNAGVEPLQFLSQPGRLGDHQLQFRPIDRSHHSVSVASEHIMEHHLVHRISHSSENPFVQCTMNIC